MDLVDFMIDKDLTKCSLNKKWHIWLKALREKNIPMKLGKNMKNHKSKSLLIRLSFVSNKNPRKTFSIFTILIYQRSQNEGIKVN